MAPVSETGVVVVVTCVVLLDSECVRTFQFAFGDPCGAVVVAQRGGGLAAV